MISSIARATFSQPLPEHSDLRGLEPLRVQYERHFSSSSSGGGVATMPVTVTAASASGASELKCAGRGAAGTSQSSLRRVATVCQFTRDVCYVCCVCCVCCDSLSVTLSAHHINHHPLNVNNNNTLIIVVILSAYLPRLVWLYSLLSHHCSLVAGPRSGVAAHRDSRSGRGGRRCCRCSTAAIFRFGLTGRGDKQQQQQP